MIRASDIRLGINVHPSQPVALIVSRMQQLGLTLYRCDMTTNPTHQQIAAAGLKGCLIHTDGPLITDQLRLTKAMEQAHPGAVEFCESRNEVNNRPTVYGGMTDTGGFDMSKRGAITAYDAAFQAAVKGDPVLGGKTTLAHTDLHASASACDYANTHGYENTLNTVDYWPPRLRGEMQAAMPGKPMAITEMGVHDQTHATAFLPQMIADCLFEGIIVVYLYELLESGQGYGIFDVSGKDRGAARTVAMMATVLRDDGPDFTPMPLNVTVSDPMVKSVLVAKSDGSFAHLLWRSQPDGKVHPFTWSYDRPMHVRAHMLASSASTAIWPSLTWHKNAGQPSDWQSYVDGVIVLELTP